MHLKLRRKLNRVSRSRQGFTLIEVLVVLAILVILFGLLFAPMMAGMDMAANGRSQARLQDTVRLAAEQMRRELSEAVYVYPPPTYTTRTGTLVTDYSQLVFVPAATDSQGRVLTPKQPRTWTGSSGTPEYLVTRYHVRPPAQGSTGFDLGYDEKNPFVLVRQQGLYRPNAAAGVATTGVFQFGSEDATGKFVVGQAMSENVITPTEDYDIPASSTICNTCGQLELGYVSVCTNTACLSTDLTYLHNTVQFRPERITGEALAPSENDTVYTARHGNWMGAWNNGTQPLGAGALSATAPELQPRIVDYRWSGGGYNSIALDSFATDRTNQIALRWNSTSGTVQVGDWREVVVHVGNCGTNPGTGFYPLTIDGTDVYDGGGTRSGARKAPLLPIYPNAPTNWNEPRMPIGYRIDPQYSDNNPTIAAKLVPQSTRILPVGDVGTGNATRGAMTRVAPGDQANLGQFDYFEYLPDDQTWGEVRFNRYNPPSPDWSRNSATGTSTMANFDLHIWLYYRRNFDPATNHDDVLYADYSTSEIINITLIPQRFNELQNYSNGLPNLVVPPDLPAGGVPVRTQAVVANARS